MKQFENPSYYAIIPANVRYSDIPPNAKLLYGEITALCSKEGFCWASNAYFAKLYKVNATTASEWIAKLKEYGFVNVDTDGKNRKIMLREKPKVASGKAEGYASGKAEHSNTREISTNNTDSTAETAVKDRNDCLALFLKINLSREITFNRPNQKKAMDRMIKQFGLEKIESMIKFLPKNNITPYAPKITTPIQLEENMGKLISFWQQQKGKLQESGLKIAIMPQKV